MSNEPKSPSILITAHSKTPHETEKKVNFHANTTTREFNCDDAPQNLQNKEIITATKEEMEETLFEEITPFQIVNKNERKCGNISEMLGMLCCLPFLLYASFLNLLFPCIKHIILKCFRNCSTKRNKNHITDVNNLFIDCDFTPNNESLNIKQLNSAEEITWLSVSEIYPNQAITLQPQTLNLSNLAKIETNLNLNCAWFVNVIVCLSQYPHLIEKLFLPKCAADQDNKHRLKLFDARRKRWKQVIIDDMIPSNTRTQKPLFTHPNHSSEAWLLLLEKCVAKFCGNYQNLNNVPFAWGLQLLSGRKVSILANTPNQRDSWTKGCVKYNSVSDKHVAKALSIRQTFTTDPREQYKLYFDTDPKQYFATKQLWNIFKEIDKSGGLIIATQMESGGPHCAFPIELAQCNACEIIQLSYGYNVLNLKEICKFRLIEISNPWNALAWQGKWGDNHAIWDEYPRSKPEFRSDTFWIELSEFILLFNVITVCHKVRRKKIESRNDVILNIGNIEANVCETSHMCCSKCFHFWCKCVSCKVMYPKIYQLVDDRSKDSKYMPKL